MSSSLISRASVRICKVGCVIFMKARDWAWSFFSVAAISAMARSKRSTASCFCRRAVSACWSCGGDGGALGGERGLGLIVRAFSRGELLVEGGFAAASSAEVF